jgi:hypothetical protein
MEVVIKMKKINAFFVFATVLVLLGGFFTACQQQLDTEDRVTITFSDPSGGNTFEPVIIIKGKTLGSKMPDNLQRDGPFLFYGWFDGASQYLPNTPIGADLTLVARWSDDVATVTFAFTQAVGGTVIRPAVDVPPVTVIKGTSLGVLKYPIDPRAKGYQFVAWKHGAEEFTMDNIINEDITVTATWVSKPKYTVKFDPGPGGGTPVTMEVFAGECVNEWENRFPADPTTNTVNAAAFFVAWFDKDENRMYNGRTPITRNLNGKNDKGEDSDNYIEGKWGLPPFKVDFDQHVKLLEGSTDSAYGNVDYKPEVVDSVIDGNRSIVNTVTYDLPYNTNRWRILYRVSLDFPDDFNVKFYTRYTIRARFYANKQGAASWDDETAFTPNKPAAGFGYSQDGLLTRDGYGELDSDGKPKTYQRSDNGWGQISWTSVANWNGQAADADTMLQRYNLDVKEGTINDTWAPSRSKDLAYPPYLLVQTSDSYIGHIEIIEIVFHNGEWEHANYEGEPKPSTGEE